jgi:polar amino acid transport system substrate-binding protein
MALRRTLGLATVALALVACAGPAGAPAGSPRATSTGAAAASPTSSAATPTEAAATAAQTDSATEAPSEPAATDAASPSAGAASPSGAASPALTLPPPNAECEGDALAAKLKNPGRLTLSTDIPSFSPWFGGDAAEQYPNEPEGGSPWSEAEFSAEPYAGEGLEGAMAYAVAEAMGFGPDEVDWLANAIFEQAFAPGEKAFDFHMAQIAVTEERAQTVTFTDPYFALNQSLVALTENEITSAASIQDLKGYRLGAAQNTTSFALIDEVIQPDVDPSVFPDNSAALAALQGNTIDAIVVDLGSAFYMRDVQLEDFDTEEPEATIVGQFGPPAEADQVAFVLDLDNPLVECVNHALATLKAEGTHQQILDQWINTGEDIPFFE